MLDRNERIKRALIGFAAGFVIGCVLNYLGLQLGNWLSGLAGKDPVTITFLKVIPLGLLLGLGMAINMSNSLFGD